VNTLKTKQIGQPSGNGFIWSIPFVKEGYTAYTVLKCSMRNMADNLFYEYYVGKNFINKYTKKFPCFVETYGSYQLTNSKWDELRSKTAKVSMTSDIIPYTGGFNESCTDSKLLSVLIQHFDSNRFTSLYNIRMTNSNNIKYEVNPLCYQLIFALSTLGNKYTHYDLHANNVFCYKPYDGNKYIQMNYHSTDGTIVSFPSEYIMKIIDYGRNYFNNGAKNDTSTILNTQICNNPKCAPNCGYENGYKTIQGNAFNSTIQFHNIFPNKPNQSSDLLFMNQVFSDIFKYWGYSIVYQGQHGTPENLINGLPDHKINNIHDARKILQVHYLGTLHKSIHKKYDSTWEKVAVMNIYDDGRDYEFIQLVSNPKMDPESDTELDSDSDDENKTQFTMTL
jgi:hypothetical protein